METEDIEKQFEEIAQKSQHLFNEPIKISKDPIPTGTYVEPKIGQEELLPLLDTNLDFISKVTRLLYVHDLLKEDIYTLQMEKNRVYKSGMSVNIVQDLKNLENIEQFKDFLDQIYKLLREAHTISKEYKTTEIYVSVSEIEKFNAVHDTTEKFLIQLNNILQRIHSLCIDILSEYNMLTKTYVNEKGLESTKILFFTIGNSVKIVNIEPYNLPKDIIYFINAFTEEVKKSEYATYINVLYITLDHKYRLDITLGAAFAHRSVILYDPRPEEPYFEHIYVDGNYSRTLAWKTYLADYLNTEIHNIDIKILETGRPKYEDLEEEEKEPKPITSLAWRDSFLKVRIEKEFLVDMAIIIYLINWDGVINHSSTKDIMFAGDEADIIYHHGIYPQAIEFEEYIPGKTRYTVKYDRKTQDAIREAIRDTTRGIEKFLYPEGQ